MKSIALLIALLLTQASIAQPGTRKLRVIAKAEDGLSMWLAPRDCKCVEKTTKSLCECWRDFEQEDQPAVVGRTDCVLRYAKALKTNLLVPFAHAVSSDGQVYVRIPSPGLGIKRFLKLLGASELFEVLQPCVFVDAVHFLRFVAQGKWVIADIDEQAPENRAYHMYLHDLNNHLFLWWLLPTHLRSLVQDRAYALDQLFDALRKKLANSQLAVDYIQVLNCLAGLLIDVKMGNLNVKTLHFSGEKNKTIKDLELMLNVGLERTCEQRPDMFHIINLLPNQFALKWFSAYQKWLSNNFSDFFLLSGELDEEEKLVKDEATKEALDRLKSTNIGIIEDLGEKVSLAVTEIAGEEGNRSDLKFEIRPLVEDFSNPIEQKLKEALEFQSNDSSRGLNVRALLANPMIAAENAIAIADALEADLARLDGSGAF
jgi:hypothetical protein